jgi:hypothetical protein
MISFSLFARIARSINARRHKPLKGECGGGRMAPSLNSARLSLPRPRRRRSGLPGQLGARDSTRAARALQWSRTARVRAGQDGRQYCTRSPGRRSTAPPATAPVRLIQLASERAGDTPSRDRVSPARCHLGGAREAAGRRRRPIETGNGPARHSSSGNRGESKLVLAMNWAVCVRVCDEM